MLQQSLSEMYLKVANTTTTKCRETLTFSDSVYRTCSQKAKNQKAKRTIMHCTTKQYDTMQCDEKKKLRSDIGLLVFSEDVMNENL